ncbi:MAG: MinD/ParA family protein [Nitrospiraceae bacterium]|nr:MinD/ParA family protein [Nitrospiraceae bacterium]
MLNDGGRGRVKTLTVASGKGGVGKTNVAVNLAVAAHKLGKKVIILDADLGLSNIDVLLSLAPKWNIQHVLAGQKTFPEIMVEGPHGIKILPASSGVQELTRLDEFQRLKIMEEFDAYTGNFDLLIIDTAAGISENVAFFCVAAEETLVVTSPEPTALTDAYALIKVLFTRYQEREFSVIINSARGPKEAFDIFKRLMLVTERFLNVSLNYVGYIPVDGSVGKAVRAQKPFVDMFPGSEASWQISRIAEKIMESKGKVKGSIQFFLGDLLPGTGLTRCR